MTFTETAQPDPSRDSGSVQPTLAKIVRVLYNAGMRPDELAKSPTAISVNGSDPILHDLRAGLRNVYGQRLARLVLFGSRARGDAKPNSDYDIAVFLHNMDDRWAEFDRVNAIASDILFRRFAVVHALPYHESSYAQNPSTLMRNIREEGIDL